MGIKDTTLKSKLTLPVFETDVATSSCEENIKGCDSKMTKQKKRLFIVVMSLFAACLSSKSKNLVFSGRLLSSSPDENIMNRKTSFPTTMNNNKTTATDHMIRGSTIHDTDTTSEDEDIPKITWLMSFPNSGTSYTLKAITKGSNVKVATNYGENHLDESGYSVPIHQTYTNGPYFTKASIDIKSKVLPSSVITKTHCGGRCQFCHPDKFVETRDTFESTCLLSNGMVKKRNIELNEGKSSIKEAFDRERDLEESFYFGHYDPSLVERAIHLFRDPFDNLVSRYHLHYKHKYNDGDETWLKSHPRSAEGFQAYCKDMLEHSQQIEDSTFFSVEWKQYAQSVPCFADMYRYVQWHNLAFEVVEKLGIKDSTYILHYEDYSEDFEGTVDSLFSFLSLEKFGDIDEFHPSDYSEYYSDSQRDYAKEFIKEFASDNTLKALQKYL